MARMTNPAVTDAGLTLTQTNTPARPEDTALALDWGRLVAAGRPVLADVPPDSAVQTALLALGRGYSLSSECTARLADDPTGQRLLAVLDAQSDLFAALNVPAAQIAIVVNDTAAPSDSERGVYYSLWRHGHSMDLVAVAHIGSSAGRYKVVFVPQGSLARLSLQCAQQLANYVRKGGVLFTEAGSFPDDPAALDIFHDLLGGGAFAPHEKGHDNLRLHAPLGSLDEGNIFWAVVDVGAQNVPFDPPYVFPADTGAIVHWLGFFEDCRQPAALRVRQGKGSIYYMGGVLSAPALRDDGEDNSRVYPAVADVYGVSRLFNLAGPEGNNSFVRYLKDSIDICVARAAGGGWLVPVVNNGDREVRFSVFVAGAAAAAKTVDLLADSPRHSIRYGTDRSVPLDLPAYGCALLLLR